MTHAHRNEVEEVNDPPQQQGGNGDQNAVLPPSPSPSVEDIVNLPEPVAFEWPDDTPDEDADDDHPPVRRSASNESIESNSSDGSDGSGSGSGSESDDESVAGEPGRVNTPRVSLSDSIVSVVEEEQKSDAAGDK